MDAFFQPRNGIVLREARGGGRWRLLDQFGRFAGSNNRLRRLVQATPAIQIMPSRAHRSMVAVSNPSSARIDSRCSPRAGIAPITGSTPSMPNRRDERTDRPNRRSDLPPGAAAGQLGMVDELFNRVETGVGDLRRLEPAHDLAGRKLVEHGRDLGVDRGTVLHPKSIPLEPGIIGERRPCRGPAYRTSSIRGCSECQRSPPRRRAGDTGRTARSWRGSRPSSAEASRRSVVHRVPIHSPSASNSDTSSAVPCPVRAR